MGLFIPGKYLLFLKLTVTYRRRINKEFKDGDVVLVYLKDRSKRREDVSADEEEWYEKAFGSK